MLYEQGNILSILGFFLWVPFALWGARRWPPATAAALLLFLPMLFLPERTGFKPPGLPGFEKSQIAVLWLFVGVVLFHRDRLRMVRLNGWVWFAILLLLVGHVATIFTNTDPIVDRAIYLPGHRPYDAVHTILKNLLDYIIPFLLGVAMFNNPKDLRVLFRTLVGLALVYSLFQLIELRLSPQLHRWVYGFFQSAFAQTIRDGGYRPTVFMRHGLAVAMFTMVGVLASAALIKTRNTIAGRNSRWVLAYLWLILLLSKSAAAFTYTVVAVPLIMFTKPKVQYRVAVALTVIVLLYPDFRAAGMVPVEDIRAWVAANYGQDRVGSIMTRFSNEELLLERASGRSMFGWGTYGRASVYDPSNGTELAIRDGDWIITWGQFGRVGFFGKFLLLLLPVLIASTQRKRVRRDSDRRLLSALALITAISAFDLLPNGNFNYLVFVLSGALLGCSRGVLLSQARRARAKRESTTAIQPASPAGGLPGYAASMVVCALFLTSCAPRCGGAESATAEGDAAHLTRAFEPVPSRPSHPHVELPTHEPAEIPARELIRASRRSCASPCPVFFDAIAAYSWAELEVSNFEWTFGDGSTSTGYMAAHVFELPQGSAKRVFEVTLVVRRKGISVARDSYSVSVRPLSRRTVCVAERDFSACPSAHVQDHFTDVSAAWNAIQTNGRILFRRGDTFSQGVRLDSSAPGPVQVGAFGDPDMPRPSIVQARRTFRLGSEWSLTDVDISGADLDEYLITLRGNHTLVMRAHLRDTHGAFVSDGPGYDFSTHKFIVDNLVTEMHGTNFIAGDYVAIVGNRMMRSEPNHHTIRIAGANHVLVAQNELISDVGHSSLTVRGAGARRPGSDYVLVRDNIFVQWATVSPQNRESKELLQHVIWERNMHMPHTSQTSIQDGLSVDGDDVIIRNNVFHQIRRAITFSGSRVHVHHNTNFIDRDNDKTHWFVASDSAPRAVVDNNLGILLSSEGGTDFISVKGADAIVRNNYGYTPSLETLCERPDGSRVCTDPKLENTRELDAPGFMRPKSDSLAVDAAVDSPVSVDLRGTARPRGPASDVGAVER